MTEHELSGVIVVKDNNNYKQTGTGNSQGNTYFSYNQKPKLPKDTGGGGGVVSILDSYGAPLAPPRTVRPFNPLEEDPSPEPSEDDGFQSFRSQWEPMFIDKAAMATTQPPQHVFVMEENLVGASLFSHFKF